MGNLHSVGVVGEIGGAYLIITAILIRFGVYRGWVERYRDERFNVVQRQGVLARFPLGLAAIAASTAVAFDWSLVMSVLLWAAAAVSFGAWVLLALAAPPWLKPNWLLHAEALGWPERATSGGSLTFVINGTGVLIIIALLYEMWTTSSPEEWIGPLIAGIGVLLYQVGKGRIGKPRAR